MGNRLFPARIGVGSAVLAVTVLVLDAAAGVLPTDGLVGWVTAGRLIVAGGLLALVVAGARLGDFRTRLDAPIVLLVLVATATTALGHHPFAPLRGLLTLVAGYYLVVGLLRREPGAVRALALTTLVGLVVVATTALGQLGDRMAPFGCRTATFADAACGPSAWPRTTGTFANPDVMAMFILLLAPVAVLVVGEVRERTSRVVVAAMVVVGYLAMATSASRAAVVAAALGAAVGLLARGRGHPSRRGRWAGLIASVLALTALTTALVLGSAVGQSVVVRDQVWRPALAVAGHHLLLGVDLGRAGEVVTSAGHLPMQYVHVHDWWLNWLVETGVVGLLAVGLLTVGSLVCALTGARTGDPVGCAGLIALVAGYAMSIADDPANNNRVALALWVVLAIVAARAPARWRARGAGRSRSAAGESLIDTPAAASAPR